MRFGIVGGGGLGCQAQPAFRLTHLPEIEVRSRRTPGGQELQGAVAQGLRRRGIDVTTTADAGLLGAGDPDHIAFAVANGRVIFSNDPDFLRLHDEGVEHPGIAYCTRM